MIELGLTRISSLLAETSFPWRAIHVAGTNGKGSICAYISGMLEAYNTSVWRERSGKAPIKHARFTSPHLIDRWDCITINQHTVPFRIFDAVEQNVLARNKQLGINASEFELLTATAFEIFSREKVDVAVVEVGMGGRLDATNVIGQPVSDRTGIRNVSTGIERPVPLVCALAKIGLDHQAFLGHTLEAIAAEKAGIMKSGTVVVCDESNQDSVLDAFKQQALLCGATVENYDGLENLPSLDRSASTQSGSKNIDAEKSQSMQMQLPTHTQQNMAVALTSAWSALTTLQRIPNSLERLDDIQLTDLQRLLKAMFEIPQVTAYPGRLQRISLKRATGRTAEALLDGAHNAQSARVLAMEVEKWRQHRRSQGFTDKVTWLLAASNSKDVREILTPILRACDVVYAVEFGAVEGMPWIAPTTSEDLAAAAREVANEADESVEAHACNKNLAEALQMASDAASEGPLVIAGSLYLVSDILRLVRDHG